MKILVAVSFLLFFTFSQDVSAVSLDLSGAYRKALDYDARVRIAHADNYADKEEIAKARALLRPNIRGNVGRGRNVTQYGYHGVLYTPDYYNTSNTGVTLRQSLLNIPNFIGYTQAKSIVAKSDIDMQNEEAGLIVRITDAYCNVLYAEENLAVIQEQVKASKEQLQQAKHRYDKGFGTITEISESQAVYNMALAECLDMVNNLEFSRRTLENLIGEYPENLCKLNPEKLVVKNPLSDQVQSWISLAMSGNGEISSARQNMEIARKEIEKQKAIRYPTLDLVAGRNLTESENNYSIGATYNTYSLSLQMSVPIYSGGFVSSSVRQAKARWIKAGEELRLQERGVQSDVRKYYNNVTGTIAQIQAYEQAVKSQETALTGTRKGFEAGLRSNMDVLDAQQKLFSARRNLAKSRYQYIINLLMLRQSAGVLSARDIEEVNNWLGKV
jgi:outer membrane protein, protease secretion system